MRAQQVCVCLLYLVWEKNQCQVGCSGNWLLTDPELGLRLNSFLWAKDLVQQVKAFAVMRQPEFHPLNSHGRRQGPSLLQVVFSPCTWTVVHAAAHIRSKYIKCKGKRKKPVFSRAEWLTPASKSIMQEAEDGELQPVPNSGASQKTKRMWYVLHTWF